jgi:hypothetical protein
VHFTAIGYDGWWSREKPKGNVLHVMSAYFKGPEIVYFRHITVAQSYIFEGYVEFAGATSIFTNEYFTFINFRDCEFIKQPKKPKT